MKSPQVENSQILQQIQSICQHQHISQVQQINPRTYTLTYTPSTIQSPYKSQTYHIELVIPQSYPDQPPALRFMEQIYHLNIGYQSGIVRMPVIQDDWSPFLSLVALVESLDRVLEMPEPDYAVQEDMLELWISDRQAYEQKVIQNVKFCQIVLCQSAQRRYSHGVNDSPIKNMGFKLKKVEGDSAALVKNLRESMEFIDLQQVGQNEQRQSKSQQNGFPEMVKAESKQNLKSGRQKFNPKPVLDNLIESQSMPITQMKKDVNSKSQQRKDEMMMQKEAGDNRTLVRMNQTLHIFIEQLNSLEQQIGMTKNKRIAQLLQQKYDTQMQMLAQLMQISEQAKKKLVLKFKHQVNKM